MPRTLDMQFIRYMNLFTKISRVQARHCFSYNNMITFVVPKFFVAKAIGPESRNLEKLSQILRKRIRIVAQPASKTPEQIKIFITTVVSPVQFNTIETKGKEVTITAGREGKARLIGRGRIRQKELQEILEQYFGIKKLNIA